MFDVNFLWVCLFLLLLSTAIMSIVGAWKFGMIMGCTLVAQMFVLTLWMPVLKSWSFPFILFVGIPVTIIILLLVFAIGVSLGVLTLPKNKEVRGKQGGQAPVTKGRR